MQIGMDDPRAIEDVWAGCVYAWLCTAETVEGLVCGRGLLGRRPDWEAAHPGQRVPAEDRAAERERERAIVDVAAPWLKSVLVLRAVACRLRDRQLQLTLG